eukprot:Plantae.Rhodophyta-Purpureofilum_apyrenoidigerum.ctg17992.p1 GENE.Plantae.Rhodophyta-Purpureofilum_apyrenoidigerum.ctg17992~~Plantae.Rhodophyta-Purpureofilum_apyrenoidigerum.ctg17992.p1  ORF type:complete len:463 (-),score=65.75 Plantae.Rhodophyta-Purpureofilum_apyrenoidigerum.ctg17992:514-1902(-)
MHSNGRRQIANGDLSVPSIVLPEQAGSIERSESEDQADYREGGYLPISAGREFEDGRYTVLAKLGWGHFSTVWLCFDAHDGCHVAIKVQKCATHYKDAAFDEIKLLNALKKGNSSGRKPVVHLLHWFTQDGSHGRRPCRHVCMVFEVLGKSLLSLIRRCNYSGCPLPLVKVITRQILEGLDYVHTQCGIIHTDVKPENVLFIPTEEETGRLRSVARDVTVRLRTKGNWGNSDMNGVTEDMQELSLTGEEGDVIFNYRDHLSDPDLMFQAGRIKVVDFGNACWTDEKVTSAIQTRQYRSPEVILDAGYDTSADIWSLACLVFELLTGDFLFDPERRPEYTRNEDHLALMMELLGPMSRNFVLSGARSSEYFTPQAELRHIRRLNFWSLRDVLREKYMHSPADSDMLSSFIMPMLMFEPSRRATARQCLQHPWMQFEYPRGDLQMNNFDDRRRLDDDEDSVEKE